MTPRTGERPRARPSSLRTIADEVEGASAFGRTQTFSPGARPGLLFAPPRARRAVSRLARAIHHAPMLLAGEVEDKIVLDAAIISSSAQAIEHYEISRYDSCQRGPSSWVTTTSENFSKANLGEEKDAHRKLSILDQAAALRGRGYTQEQGAVA